MNIPQFLVVRYANGSAGKFLVNLLMSSKSAAHFEPTVEQNKTDISCIGYTQQHFVGDLDNWLIHEPKHSDAWNLHHISSNYGRGEQLTADEFLSIAKQDATDYFWESVNNGKCIPFVWNKPTVPEFFKSAKFITIIIDPDSVKWYHRARWYKQYSVKDNKIHIKEHDPKYNSTSVTKYYDQFNNSYIVDQHPFSFIKQNILRSPKKLLFQNCDTFINQPINQEFINLSDILNVERCRQRVYELCIKFNLEPISDNLITECHKHWLNCHNFKYSKK
jgi:hypothetical protein